MHEIGHVGEDGVDPMDLAVLDLERLDQRDRVRPLEHRAHLAAVGEQITVERVRVIEEARRDDDLPLLVDERIAPFADTLVDAIDAEPELLLAALRDRRRVVRAAAARAGRVDAVLDALAVLVERREDDAVVELDGAEVAVGERDETFARNALFGRYDLVERRVVVDPRRIAEWLRHVRPAAHDRLDLGDLAVLDLDSHREIRRIPVLLDDAEPCGVAGLLVGDRQRLFPDGVDRAPQALAERHLDVVLGEADVPREGRTRCVAVEQRVEIALRVADQAVAIAVDVNYRARLAGRLRVAWRSGERERRGEESENGLDSLPVTESGHASPLGWYVFLAHFIGTAYSMKGPGGVSRRAGSVR